MRESGIYEQAGTPCRFSAFVLCGERDKCKTCGWSPAVKRKRVEAIRQRRAAELSGEREPEIPEDPREIYIPRKRERVGRRTQRPTRTDEEVLKIMRSRYIGLGGDLSSTQIGDLYGIGTARLAKARAQLMAEREDA